MLARSVSMNGAKPCAISPCGENEVRPQSWPLGLKKSGGAPMLRSVRNASGVGADLRAVAIEADRQVGDQADAHAGVFRRLLRGGEGAVGQPLQEGVEVMVAVASFEAGVAGEALALLAHEGLEGRRRRFEEVFVSAAEQGVLVG